MEYSSSEKNGATSDQSNLKPFIVIDNEEDTRRMEYRTWLVFNIKALSVLKFWDILF